MAAPRPRRAAAPYNKRIPSSETPTQAAARKHKARREQLAAAVLRESEDDGAVVPLQWSKRQKGLRVAFSRGVETGEDSAHTSTDTSAPDARALSRRSLRSIPATSPVHPIPPTPAAAPAPPAPRATTANTPNLHPTPRRRPRMPYNAFKAPFKTPPPNADWLRQHHPETFAAFEAFSSRHAEAVSFSKDDLPAIIRDDYVNGPWEEIFVTRQDAVNRPWPVNRIRKWLPSLDEDGNRVVRH